MSKGEYLSVSRTNNPPGYDGDLLQINVGSSSILIDSLNIRDTCNSETPHGVIGLGYSIIMITNEQLMKLLCEYVRFKVQSFDQDVKYTSEDCSSTFSMLKKQSKITKIASDVDDRL